MHPHETPDTVTLIIKACHKSENEAKRIYHQIAEQRRGSLKLDNGTTVHLSKKQIGEFVERYSSEVEPTYWESKRLKH